MNRLAKRLVLHSVSGYDKKYDALLQNLIDKKFLLFCAVGKDCQLWHDILDELYVGNGIERDFDLITTWHKNESLQEVIEFAEDFSFFDSDGLEIEVSNKVEVIEV